MLIQSDKPHLNLFTNSQSFMYVNLCIQANFFDFFKLRVWLETKTVSSYH